MPGYAMTMLKIDDPEVVATSGRRIIRWWLIPASPVIVSRAPCSRSRRQNCSTRTTTKSTRIAAIAWCSNRASPRGCTWTRLRRDRAESGARTGASLPRLCLLVVAQEHDVAAEPRIRREVRRRVPFAALDDADAKRTAAARRGSPHSRGSCGGPGRSARPPRRRSPELVHPGIDAAAPVEQPGDAQPAIGGQRVAQRPQEFGGNPAGGACAHRSRSGCR